MTRESQPIIRAVNRYTYVRRYPKSTAHSTTYTHKKTPKPHTRAYIIGSESISSRFPVRIGRHTYYNINTSTSTDRDTRTTNWVDALRRDSNARDAWKSEIDFDGSLWIQIKYII